MNSLACFQNPADFLFELFEACYMRQHELGKTPIKAFQIALGFLKSSNINRELGRFQFNLISISSLQPAKVKIFDSFLCAACGEAFSPGQATITDDKRKELLYLVHVNEGLALHMARHFLPKVKSNLVADDMTINYHSTDKKEDKPKQVSTQLTPR